MIFGPTQCQVIRCLDIVYMTCVYGVCGLSFSQEQTLPTPVSWLSLDKHFHSGLLSHILRGRMLCFLIEVLYGSNMYCTSCFDASVTLFDSQFVSGSAAVYMYIYIDYI